MIQIDILIVRNSENSWPFHKLTLTQISGSLKMDKKLQLGIVDFLMRTNVQKTTSMREQLQWAVCVTAEVISVMMLQ